jgi:hypothetical protein
LLGTRFITVAIGTVKARLSLTPFPLDAIQLAIAVLAPVQVPHQEFFLVLRRRVLVRGHEENRKNTDVLRRSYYLCLVAGLAIKLTMINDQTAINRSNKAMLRCGGGRNFAVVHETLRLSAF